MTRDTENPEPDPGGSVPTLRSSFQAIRSCSDRSRLARVLPLVALGCLTTSCATVRSTALPNDTTTVAQGVTYYLPMRQMKVSATRTPLNLDELKKAVPGKRTAAADAKKAADTAEAARKAAEATLANLDAAAPATARAELEVAVATAKGAEAAAKNAQAKTEMDLRDLEATVVAATLSRTQCSYEAKIELLPPQPDPRHRYAARIVHNPFRDDTLALKVGPNALLTSTNVVAADRTSDILVEAAGAIAALGGVTPVAAPPSGVATSAEPKDCAKLPKTFIGLFDPAEAASVAKVNSELATSHYPFQVAVTLPTATTGGGGARGSTYGGLATGSIYYRTPAPVLVSLQQGDRVPCEDKCVWQPVDGAVALAPQAGPISFIPLNGSAFVKTVNDVQFVDGSISSWTAERPSEVLEVVRLPVKILTALISIPAQIFSLKVDYASKDKALAEAQVAQIQAQKQRDAYLQCLALAGTDLEAARGCAP